MIVGLCFAPASAIRAAITFTGNINPADPANWNGSTPGYVGYTGDGTLIITDGSDLISNEGYIGYQTGRTGLVTVNGNGSTWTTSGSGLNVGYYGTGTLNILNGGYVSASSGTRLGYNTGSIGAATVDGPGSRLDTSNLYVGFDGSGTLDITNGGVVNCAIGTIGDVLSPNGRVTVDGAGSQLNCSGDLNVGESAGTLNISHGAAVTANGNTWVNPYSRPGNSINFGVGSGTLTTGSLIATASDLVGTGTINTHGFVSDIDLVFDSSHPLVQSFQFGNVAIHLDMSNASLNGRLGAGYKGNGSIIIQDGLTVTSKGGNIGLFSGSTGVVTVSGTGSKWVCSSDQLHIGFTGKGTLNILDGGTVISGSYGNISFNPGSTGEVNVSGTGSSWTHNGSLKVGMVGNGKLNISGGATVTVLTTTSVASTSNSGYINFGPGSGTLTTRSLIASPGNITGSGTIYTRGLVSDIDLRFDSTHPLVQSILFNNATLNLNMSDPATNDTLGAGCLGNGSLTIRDGVSVTSSNGSLGTQRGSQGVATVEGAGTSWSVGVSMTVGSFGSGVLNIVRGGHLTDNYGNIATYPDGRGSVKVDGPNSQWINNIALTMGAPSGTGNGVLNVSGGGIVRAKNVTVNATALLAIDVGTGSQLIVNNGTGTITNNKTVRFLAGASPVENATYTPIAAFLWNGAGTYQSVGGKWNPMSRQFTVSAVQAGDAGLPITIDRLSTQRMLITDGDSPWKLGASFASATATAPLTFTATPISDAPLNDLNGILGVGQQILSGWTISSSNGYTPGDPVYLSFGGRSLSGLTSDDLHVWSYNGTSWLPLTANDLTCDSNYGSFTTTSMGTFAVTVPEPSTINLVALALIGSVSTLWRKGWESEVTF